MAVLLVTLPGEQPGGGERVVDLHPLLPHGIVDRLEVGGVFLEELDRAGLVAAQLLGRGDGHQPVALVRVGHPLQRVGNFFHLGQRLVALVPRLSDGDIQHRVGAIRIGLSLQNL